MAAFLVFTRAEAPKFQKLIMWLFGLPVRGTHVGGGIHVDMPPVAPNPCPRDLPGWGTRQYNWIAHPANTGAASDQFAVRLHEELREAYLAKRARLTVAQRTWVQGHVDTAKELALAWMRDVAQPGGGTTKQLVEHDDVEPET